MRALAIPPDWPGRDASRHVSSRPHLWHVQDRGSGPQILLLHGAGASAHSWRGLVPALGPGWRLTALDLPGQGFTARGGTGRCSLNAMAEDIAALAAAEGWRPAAIVGHSAGAALALRLAAILPRPPAAVVGINAALSPFQGAAGVLFPMMARLLALNPFVPQVFARLWRDPAQVDRLIRATGSTLDQAGLGYYLRLVRDAGHVDATLAMMAAWRLDALNAALPRMELPVLLIAGDQDRAVPPETQAEAARRLPRAVLLRLPGGHLLHEETPQPVAGAVAGFLHEAGLHG
jgi:magnesium chelatase accessory protein